MWWQWWAVCVECDTGFCTKALLPSPLALMDWRLSELSLDFIPLSFLVPGSLERSIDTSVFLLESLIFDIIVFVWLVWVFCLLFFFFFPKLIISLFRVITMGALF